MQKSQRLRASIARTAPGIQLENLKELEHSPGGAKAGHASLMRPNRPLPTLPFADLPLRRNPNNAAAVIATFVTRGHCTSLGLIARITPTSDPAHNLNLGE